MERRKDGKKARKIKEGRREGKARKDSRMARKIKEGRREGREERQRK